MELVLVRTYHPNGTNGMLYYNSSFQCFTIELPWLNNRHNISCIPEGRYGVSMRYTPKRKTHILVEGVKDRALILIHPANDALKELQGCIAPVTAITGEGKGNFSKKAFNDLIRLVQSCIGTEPVFLTIKSK